MSTKDVAQQFIGQFEEQALTSIVGGFSFASAVAWMDFVRYFNSRLVKVEKNGAQYYLLTALVTTVIGILVYMTIKRLKPSIKRGQPVYAVTG